MKYLVILSLMLMSLTSMAGELKSREDVKAFANEVMTLVGKGKVIEGLEKFKPHLIIPESEFQVTLEQFELQQPMIDQRFGKTVGAELIDIEEQGKSLMLVIFIQKFEKHIMRWKMYFYKPNGHWVLNTYRTDDKIQSVFTY